MIKKFWLLKYYVYNLLFVRILGNLTARLKPSYSYKFNGLKEKESIRDKDEFLIVGNGPSLTAEDLTELKHLPSIASNKIDLLFDQTNWRPDIFTIHDPLLSYKMRNNNFDNFPDIFCSYNIYNMLSLPASRKNPWKNIPLLEAEELFEKNGTFVPDPVQGFFEGYTITIHNIQIAIWLGAKRIYLIGVDHFYKEVETTKLGTKLEHEETSHFHPEYRKKGEIVNHAPIKYMEHAYHFMHKVAKSLGVEIINISRNSKLDEYPKMSIDELIGEKRLNKS